MVDNQNLQLTFPHIEYAGQRYHVVLDFAGDLGDGLYWKFKTIEPTTVTCGGVVDGNLNIQNVCALLSGNEYQVNLEFRENPFGQIGLFWKLASNIVQNRQQYCAKSLRYQKRERGGRGMLRYLLRDASSGVRHRMWR